MSIVLKHSKRSKASSRSTAFFADLFSLGSPEAIQARLESMPTDELRPLLLDGIEEDRSDSNSKLLIELANLHDDGCKRFWSKYGPIYFAFLSDAELLRLRDEVRLVWDPNKSDAEKQRIIDTWLSYRLGWHSIRYGADSPLWVVWRYRRVLPNPFNLRASLAFALVENASRLTRCANLACAVPYFLAKRSTQKFCERGECTAFAQRQYALAWWNAKGRDARAAKARTTKTARTKRKKSHGKKPRGRRLQAQG